MAKREKKEKEPQYYTSLTNIQVLNYKVYYMGKTEKIICFIAAIIVGAMLGYLFFGGIGKDGFGKPTMVTHVLNLGISTGVGMFTGCKFIPIRIQQILKKRNKMLRQQFRDMLECLTTSLGAGKNVTDAFMAVQVDLEVQYDADAFILQELAVIVSGLRNNQAIEDLLYDFGKRSGVKEILMFANIFKISYRKGGNIKDIICNTNEIMKGKMEIAEEIETVITSGKSELNTMMAMPILLIGMIKMMSPDFAENFTSLTGIFSTVIALGMFVAAFYIGRAVMEIKI